MSRRARVIMLCEDNQHEAFARRFLAKVRGRVRDIRVVKAPRAGGSGEQFVRKSFPDEVNGLRRTHVASVLIVLVDGDEKGVAERVNGLNDECSRRAIAAPTEADHVFVFVPTRAIRDLACVPIRAVGGRRSVVSPPAPGARLHAAGERSRRDVRAECTARTCAACLGVCLSRVSAPEGRLAQLDVRPQPSSATPRNAGSTRPPSP